MIMHGETEKADESDTPPVKTGSPVTYQVAFIAAIFAKLIYSWVSHYVC
jgi:hypothetical protein